MVFNSIEFIIFGILFFIIYFSLKGSYRLFFCLAASYFFYAWWDWRFLSLIIISTTADFFIGILLGRVLKPKSRKILLISSLTINLGILALFKYYDFFIHSLQNAFHHFQVNLNFPILNLILPIGISFYTFQTLSYTIDIYRNKCEVETNFLRFASYVSLFPQLVAGPIVRANHLLPQLKKNQAIDWHNISKGVEFIAWGFFLKLCIADTLAVVVDLRFLNPQEFGALALIVAVFFFSFQIYSDFAGYSYIAIGLGRIMGFDFGRNFSTPYFSRSFSEFWTRWHISLSTWLRDYLYIPLGGNRGGNLITFRNLAITMFLGGLWHGANWTFVIWGMLHGLYLILQRIFSPLISKILPKFVIDHYLFSLLQMAVIFLMTSFAWIFFRSGSLSDAVLIINKIFNFDQFFLKASVQKTFVIKGFMLISALIFIDGLRNSTVIRNWYYSNGWIRMVSILILIWGISLLGVFSDAAFIYFQF